MLKCSCKNRFGEEFMKSEDENEKRNKAGNPIFILIMFGALMGFLFYAPDIYKKYNSEINNFFGGGSNDGEDGNKQQDNKSPVSAYYQLGSRSTLKFNEINLSDISLEGKTLKLTVNTDNTIDLDDLDYYVEFYRNRETFIGRRVLHGRVTKKLPMEIDVTNLDIDTTTYMVVSHIEEGTIKPLETDTDESGLSMITCSKDNSIYEYEFYLKKLTKTIYKYNYSNTDFDQYARTLLDYQKKEDSYNEYTGVTSRIIESTNSFVFLSEFDYSKVSSFSNIGDPRIYDKGTTNNIIKFKMDAEGYECK